MEEKIVDEVIDIEVLFEFGVVRLVGHIFVFEIPSEVIVAVVVAFDVAAVAYGEPIFFFASVDF